MEVIRLLAAFIVTTIAGWNLACWIFGRDRSFSAAEKCAFSFITGLGLITVQMFFYSLMDIRFSIPVLLWPHMLLLAINSLFFRRVKATEAPFEKAGLKRFDMLLISGIAVQVFHAFFKALIKPMDSFDSIGNFAFKSKLFFFNRYIPYEFFMDRSIDIQHPDYPLFIPLSETWIYMFLRNWNDLLVKAIFPAFFVVMLVLFFFALKRIIGRRLSLVSTFFLATIPHFLNYATIGYADFALIMFYSMSFIYMFLWMVDDRKKIYLILSALLAVLALWTKQEAKMLTLINIFVLFLYLFIERARLNRSDLRRAGYYTLVVLLCLAGWLGFMNSMGFENELANESSLTLQTVISNLDRVPLILYEYQKHIFGPKKWNLSLLVFFFGLIFYFRRAFTGEFKYITIPILLAFAGYGACFIVTPLEIRYHLQTAGSRLLLHFLPVVVFWIGYLAKEISSGESDIHR